MIWGDLRRSQGMLGYGSIIWGDIGHARVG